jgi:hypothetical protein
MNRRTLNAVASAEDSVKQLIEECRKDGPLYQRSPREVAHVSRTSKWLLNAIGKLRGCLRHRRTNETL